MAEILDMVSRALAVVVLVAVIADAFDNVWCLVARLIETVVRK